MGTTHIRSGLAALVLLTAGACGGGAAKPEPEAQLPHPKNWRVYSTPALDGVVTSDGSADASGATPFTGDLDGVTNGLGGRQFYSFEIPPLPAGSVLLSATVGFNQLDRVGTPYNTHGPVVFERVDYGASLDGADYDTPSLGEIGALIANNPSTFQTGFGITGPITPMVQALLGTPSARLQFRLRFRDHDSDADGVSDYTVWADSKLAPAPSIYAATLDLWYQPPAIP